MNQSSEDFRVIPLTRGQSAKVSLEDYDRLSQWRWHADELRKSGNYYAKRSIRGGGRVLMHRAVLGLSPEDPLRGHHLNHDTLDNRRSNLRAITSTQNVQNQHRSSNNTSGFKGVCFYKRTGSYQAYINWNGNRKHLGYFNTPEQAAAVYNEAASRLHGAYALLNPLSEVTL